MAQQAVQSILKQKIYSRVDLTADSIFRFFNEQNTPSKFGNIDSPSKFDQNANVEVHRVNLFVIRTDGTAVDKTTLAKVAALIESTFWTFKQNTINEIISFATAAVLVAPMDVAAAGASAYNPLAILSGSFEFDIIWKIAGGQTINISMLNPEAVDLTGISVLMELEGVIDRSQSVEQV